MARKRRNGFNHVGRAVDTTPVTITKDVVISKAANADIADAGLTTLAFDALGKASREFQARRVGSVVDNNDAINPLQLFQSGVLVASSLASDRQKELPSATVFCDNVLDTRFNAFDFSIVNADTNNSVTLLSSAGGLTFVGSNLVKHATSGLFRALRESAPGTTNAVFIIRLA